MLKKTITRDEVINFFNELINIDKSAIAALIANRVPCNERLANHPTVQVGKQNEGYDVGMLGILNGLFGCDNDGFGGILFCFDDKNNLIKVISREEQIAETKKAELKL